MKYVIIFYTAEPKPPEIFYPDEMQKMIERIVELTKNRAKFTVNTIGDCIGDFS